MIKELRLPFKGDFKHTQGFGANPVSYFRFGINGHDGDDWLMPIGTKIVSPVNGLITRVKVDSGGWGLYVQIWDKRQKLLVNLTHLDSVNMHVGDVMEAGQEVARSGNTGNSSAPHLHIACADTGDDGKRLGRNNGYRGWYSIRDSERIKILANPPEPVANSGDQLEGQLPLWNSWMVRVEKKIDQISKYLVE